MNRPRRFAAALLLAAGAAMLLAACGTAGGSQGRTAATSASSRPYYQGKTIDMVITSSAGGGLDLLARALGNAMVKNIPGHPQITFENHPGGAHSVGNDFFVSHAKPDGLTLIYTASAMLNTYVAQGRKAHFDPLKYQMVGGLNLGPEIVLIRPQALPRLKNPSASPVVVGDTNGIRDYVAYTAMVKDALGWNFRWVYGYAGSPQLVLALREGEIDVDGTKNLKDVKSLVSEKVAVPLFVAGPKRLAEFPKVPTLDELLGSKKPTGLAAQAYQAWLASDLVNHIVAAPPGTPSSVMQILRHAFAKAPTDPAYLKEVQRIGGGAWSLLTAQQVSSLAKTAVTVPADVKAELTKLRAAHGLPTGT